eukprot:ANDGO_06694.mRNA.1 Protein bem46
MFRGLVPVRNASTVLTIATVIVGVPACVYALKCLSLVVFQNKVLYMNYFPPGSRKLDADPRTSFGASFSDVSIATADGIRLHCWSIPAATTPDKQPTLVYFHGNAGNVAHRIDLLKNLHKLNVNLFVPSYRGYGLSSGSPSESGLKLDAQAIMKYVMERELQHAQFILFGHSLGGAVAAYATSLHPERVSLLVLENTFTNIPDMLDEFYPKWTLYRYLKFALKSIWDTRSIVKDQRMQGVPMLFISGEFDEIVPPKMMKML